MDHHICTIKWCTSLILLFIITTFQKEDVVGMSTKMLTNTLVESLKPKEKVYEVHDHKVKGFFLIVHPGGTKTYTCSWGRGKKIAIGRSTIFTATQARQQAILILGEVAKGIDPRQKKRKKIALTFKEFVEQEYMPWYEVAYSATCKETIKDIKRHFFNSFGDILLQDLTLAMVEKWRIQRSKVTRIRMREGIPTKELIRPSTINRNIEKLNSVLNKAVELSFLKVNPVKNIKKLKVDQPNRLRFLIGDEYKRLLDSLDNRETRIKERRKQGNKWRSSRGYDLKPDLSNEYFSDYLKPMVLISLGSGIRFGSLCRLKWGCHVDFSDENIMLTLTPDIVKTKKGYEVPLGKLASNTIKRWYQQTENVHHGKGWVFPGKQPGSHITTVKKSFKKVLQEAGIEDFTWYGMRHDFASQCVMAGIDLLTLMRLMGHTDPNTTKMYAHLTTEHKIIAIDRLENRREDLLKR